MAVFAAILVPKGAPLKVDDLAASTSSAALSLGYYTLFAINATQDITIKFGTSGMGAAAATDFRVPLGETHKFDMGNLFTHVRVFNLNGAATADIHIQPLSQF